MKPPQTNTDSFQPVTHKDWGKFHLISGAFSVVNILVLLKHNWFFSGNALAPGALAFVLTSVAILFFIRVIIQNYFTKQHTDNFQAAWQSLKKLYPPRLNQLSKKLAYNGLIEHNATNAASPKTGLTMRTGLLVVVASSMVIAAGFNITQIYRSWVAGSHSLQIGFILGLSVMLSLLVFCFYKQIQEIQAQHQEREQQRQHIICLQQLAYRLHQAFTQFYDSQKTRPNNSVDDSHLENLADIAEIEHNSNVSRSMKPNFRSTSPATRIYHLMIMPVLDTLAATAALLFTLDGFAQLTLQTPALLSFSSPIWLIALEICLALSIAIPYATSSTADAKADLTIMHFPKEHLASLSLCSKAFVTEQTAINQALVSSQPDQTAGASI